MYLYHKNNIVAKLIMYQGQPIGIDKIYNKDLLPIGMNGDLDFADRNFMDWNGQRVIPDGRVNIDIIREKLGNTAELSAKSLGLSLTDCYWFVPELNDGLLTWENVNFHDNGFISDILLLKQGQLNVQHRSPDYTTGGVLDKFWFYNNGRSYLAKLGTMPGVQDEPVLAANEVIASKIANRLKIPCVEYTPIYIGDKIGCVSQCFSKQNEDVVTAQSIAYQMDTYDSSNVMSYIRDIGFSKDIDNMITLNSLIGNHDAHLSNFALGFDSETREYTRFIPLFDNGSSFGWNRVPYNELMMKPLNKKPSLYVQNSNTFVELPDLYKLKGDVYDVYNEYQISDMQTQIAINTLTEGYNAVNERMLELEIDEKEFDR